MGCGASASKYRTGDQAAPRHLLLQPSVIFDCCDVSKTGLDENALPYALRAMGLLPEWTQALQQLGFSLPLSKDEFHQLTKMLEAMPDMSCDAEVPHSLRGMSMKQLADVFDTFVASGWLQACCDEHNKKHPSSEFPQQENLYSIDHHVVRPLTRPGPSPAREQDVRKLFPTALFKCCLAQLLNPRGCTLHYFVSHMWSNPFKNTINALRLWSMKVHRKPGLADSSEVTFWICLFALNQHRVESEVGKNPTTSPFNAAVSQAKAGVVMIVNEGARTFDRIWCLFEVSRVAQLEADFELICEHGSLVSMMEDVHLAFVNGVVENLAKFRIIEAKASSEKDRILILQEILDPNWAKSFKDSQGSPWYDRRLAFLLAQEVAFLKFKNYIKNLLSQELFEQAMVMKDRSNLLLCIACGAQYDMSDIHFLDFLNPSEEDLTMMLMAASRSYFFTHIPSMKRRKPQSIVEEERLRLLHMEELLRRGANVNGNYSWPDGSFGTPLTYAAFNHWSGAVHLLLEHAADINQLATDSAVPPVGLTPLQVFIAADHSWNSKEDSTKFLKVLLRSRADPNVEASPSTPFSALNHSVTLGWPIEHVEMLLQSGADVNYSLPVYGITALTSAVQHGRVDCVQLLLSNRADLGATMAGLTALDLARSCGNQEIVDLLLPSL